MFHIHDNYEIALVLTDAVNFFVNDEMYIIDTNSLLVFNDTDLHRCICSVNNPYNRYIIELSPEFIRSLSTAKTNLLSCFNDRDPGVSPVAHLTPEASASLQVLLDDCIRHSHGTGYGDDIMSRVKIEQLMILINQIYATNPVSKSLHIDPDFKRVEPILQYILSNLDKELSIEKIAAQFYISPRQLTHIFKKTTGFTINEYITLNRINRAKRLLITEHSISFISEKVGFNSDSHFIRTFHKITGNPPKKYAKLYSIRARL